jgi:xylulose-5-phosphate/fructose-6-phosphate phosphoketolase
MTTQQIESHTTPQELELIDRYWRAANYLSVGQIYLLDNPLLREPLQAEHVKPRLLGHWGTTPGLNLLYAHMNRVIKQRDLNALYVTGPGHGGPGLVANAYLEGTYSEVYASITGPGGHAGPLPPVLLSRRHPEPCGSGDTGLDS